MKFEIKSWLDGRIIFEGEFGSMRLCVEAAVKSGASLDGASLDGASLDGASLVGARLDGASLVGARLVGASLDRASLDGASLDGASLVGASLDGASIKHIKGGDFALAQMRITPQEGAFVGWKKLRGDVIAKLVIPHDAARVNCLGSRKCRAERAFVHTLYREDGTLLDANAIAYDRHTGKTAYQEGLTVLPDSFDPSITVECSHGIHFFITREEAAAY